MISGSAVNAAGNPEGSMGIASGDFDADGDEDLFITNIVGETFAFYENDGRGNFEDVRTRVGLAAPTAAFTGFGTDWFDYDHDGWLDLFVTNGAVNIVEAQRGQPTPFRMRNQLFRNTGSGRFEETSAAGRARRSRGRRSAAARRLATSTTTATSTSSSPTTAGRSGCSSTRRGRIANRCSFASSRRRRTGWRLAPGWGSNEPDRRRCGGA